jgi:hypothetical protein
VSKLFNWGGRREQSVAEPPLPAPSPSVVWSSVVLPKFLNALSQIQSPVLLDLGPVVGVNVAYFGNRLACKMLIGDLRRDLDAPGAGPIAETREKMLTRLKSTVTQPIHGVLCWDAFDYLDRQTSQALGTLLTSVLAPGGVVHGIFGATTGDLPYRTRYVLHSATSLECQRTPAAPVKRTVLATRDLTTMFSGLTVVESVLLKSQHRESFLRKA